MLNCSRVPFPPSEIEQCGEKFPSLMWDQGREGEGEKNPQFSCTLSNFIALLCLKPCYWFIHKGAFVPRDTEVAWTLAGNGNTGACRSLLLASRAVQVMCYSCTLCSLTNSHGHHLAPACLEDFQHGDRKVFNSWECRWAQLRRVWIWASHHALTQLDFW